MDPGHQLVKFMKVTKPAMYTRPKPDDELWMKINDVIWKIPGPLTSGHFERASSLVPRVSLGCPAIEFTFSRSTCHVSRVTPEIVLGQWDFNVAPAIELTFHLSLVYERVQSMR